jgi:hypothetical protein
MKKSLAVAVLIVAAALAFGAEGAYPDAGAYSVAQNEAIVILNQLGLYTEAAGSLTLKESLVIGDRLTLLNKAQKFKLDKVDKDFIKVKAPSGVEGWVRAPYALSKVSLAVVKADPATVYSQPRDVSVTAKSVSNMTIVAVLKDGSSAQWSKINCFDAVQNVYYTEADNIYVPKEELTFSEVDINAAIIYMTATAAKSKEVKANLFKVIEKKYSASVFFEKIQAALSPSASAQAAASKPSAPASGIYLVNDDDVNVRSAPDEVNGSVVGKLAKGAQVEVVEATTKSYTIGSWTAQWYRIKDPAGWVFGYFIGPKP